MTLYGYHGALPEENKLGQRFVVDLTLFADLQEAGEQDDLRLTVDYAQIVALAQEIVGGPPKKLLESVAETLCGTLLERFPRIDGVWVRLAKTDPPIPGTYKDVAVVLTRWRSR